MGSGHHSCGRDRALDRSHVVCQSIATMMSLERGRYSNGIGEILGGYSSSLQLDPASGTSFLPLDVDGKVYAIYLKARKNSIECRCKYLEQRLTPLDASNELETIKKCLAQASKRGCAGSIRLDKDFLYLHPDIRGKDLDDGAHFRRFVRLLMNIHASVVAPLERKPPAVSYVFPGWFQPYHRGHHDIVRRLLKGDKSVFCCRSDAKLAEYPVCEMIIAVGSHSPPDERNPLDIKQRRMLIKGAIAKDGELTRDQKLKIVTEPYDSSTAQATFPVLRENLSLAGSMRFVSGEPDNP